MNVWSPTRVVVFKLTCFCHPQLWWKVHGSMWPSGASLRLSHLHTSPSMLRTYHRVRYIYPQPENSFQFSIHRPMDVLKPSKPRGGGKPFSWALPCQSCHIISVFILRDRSGCLSTCQLGTHIIVHSAHLVSLWSRLVWYQTDSPLPTSLVDDCSPEARDFPIEEGCVEASRWRRSSGSWDILSPFPLLIFPLSGKYLVY